MERREAWLLDLDVMPYEEALTLQEHLVAKRSQGVIGDTLLLLEHPPVVTITRKKTSRNILAPLEQLRDEGISLYKTNRGGDITYHGPGQLVGYPILDLKNHGKDLHRYVHNLEEILINLLKDYGVEGHRESGYPGVWVKDEKIAAIGIAVKKGWISMHGFSLNVDPCLDHFSLIVPCGIKDKGVTSLRKVLGRTVDKQQVRQRLIHHLSDMFQLRMAKVALESLYDNAQHDYHGTTKNKRE